MNLKRNILHISTGEEVKNFKEETMGYIIDFIYDKGNNIQYMIIGSDQYFGNKRRYFAIPVSDKWMKITSKGTVFINADKKDLKLAKGISVEECPTPIFEAAPLMYELFNFHKPTLNFNRNKTRPEKQMEEI